MRVNCGNCFECCNAYANMWASRCMHEAKHHDQNCFITLTYKETDYDLHKEHLQKFLKRLRRSLEPRTIRYYACGEYGGQYDRPHYHLIIFGWFPEDARYLFTKKGVKYFESKILERLWQGRQEIWRDGCEGGYVTLAEVNYRACKYCAKYLQKLDKRKHKIKPFVVMSRKPGIGADFVNPNMLIDGLMYVDGKSIPLPKFYLDKLEQQGYNVDVLKAKRQYIYRNKVDSFENDAAVDSAQRRGKYHEEWLYKMR